MNFDGDPLKNWRFVRAFDNNVKENVDDSAKLAMLMRMCVGRVGKVIASCVAMEPSTRCKRARELLDYRFSNTYTVVDTWIIRVTVGQVISPEDCDGLGEFADELRHCVETLKAMGYISEISSQREMVKIVEMLPRYLRSRWLKKVQSTRKKSRIEHLLTFVERGCYREK
ncbi:MAG: hypothetical protein M3H12_16875 [Chromatiales bacterium]